MYNSNGQGRKTLVRRRENRMVAGVCAGLADYFALDVNLIRVVLAVVTVLTGGAGALAYLVAWAVIPEEGQPTSIAEEFVGKNRSQ